MKSAARGPAIQAVCESRAYSGYIEYVGAKDNTDRPGPPKACSSCSMISFEPLAAQVLATVRPTAPSPLR